MKMIGEMSMAVDTNYDMAIDRDECAALEDEEHSEMCNMVIDHCDFNGDGAVCGCEFLGCLHMYGQENDCIAECPCKPGNESMYC
jgi:hypothetical protein